MPLVGEKSEKGLAPTKTRSAHGIYGDSPEYPERVFLGGRVAPGRVSGTHTRNHSPGTCFERGRKRKSTHQRRAALFRAMSGQ